METRASQGEDEEREEKGDDARADASQLVGWGLSRLFCKWMCGVGFLASTMTRSRRCEDREWLARIQLADVGLEPLDQGDISQDQDQKGSFQGELHDSDGIRGNRICVEMTGHKMNMNFQFEDREVWNKVT